MREYAGGYYRIIPDNAPNKALILDTSNNVVLSDDCSSSRALWRIRNEGSGRYSFINKANESTSAYTMSNGGSGTRGTVVKGETYGSATRFKWTLKPTVSSISLPSSMEMTVGETKTLNVTFSPTDALNKALSWTSSSSDVVSVNGSGTVTAKAVGTATITARSSESSNKYATCIIRVKYCGGDNYRDVTKHKLVMQNDGHYICSVCKYRVISPILQDKEILSQEDYLKVISCEQAFIYYSYLAEEELCTVTGLYAPYGMLKLIDDIRSLPQYAELYDFKDSSGRYYRSKEELYTSYIPQYGDGPLPSHVTTLKVNCSKVTNGNILLHNGVLGGVVEIGMGIASVFFGVPGDLLAAIMISMSEKNIINSSNTFLQMLIDQIPDKSLSIPLSLLLDLIVLGSTAEAIQVGDYIIEIKILHGGSGYKTKTIYSSDGSLKKTENSVTNNY